jgi:hypothetical protein
MKMNSYLKTPGQMTMNPITQKHKDAVTLFEESVLKPDVRLRQCARNQDCYDELMQIREDVLEYLKTLR